MKLSKLSAILPLRLSALFYIQHMTGAGQRFKHYKKFPYSHINIKHNNFADYTSGNQVKLNELIM